MSKLLSRRELDELLGNAYLSREYPEESENPVQILMDDAIREGKRRHAENPCLGSEDQMIKYAVSEFIWEQLRGVILSPGALEALGKITK